MGEIALVPERTALINVDLQRHFVDSAPDGLAVVDSVNRLAAACRDAGVLVIHTRHVLRTDGSNMGVLAAIPKIQEGLLNEGAESAAFTSPTTAKLGGRGSARALFEGPASKAHACVCGLSLDLALRD